MSNVTPIGCITTLDIPAEAILKYALEQEVDKCLVIGYDKNGDFYFASSWAGGPDVVWVLEQAKKQLLESAS